jgi:hypothetical protein
MKKTDPSQPRRKPKAGLAQLQHWARQKLAASGLSQSHIDILQLEYCSALEAAELLPEWGLKAGEGIVIPYHDLKGRRNGFCRFRRRDEVAGKSIPKYLQPSGTGVHPYFVPSPFPCRTIVPLARSNEAAEAPKRSWAKIAADSTIPVGLTEGEFKSATCVLRTGFPVIGLGGVWAFQQKKQGIFWLPELEKFEWKGRHVPLIFDYSVTFNPNVTQALFALATELTNRGALPYISTLLGPEKGIDDYLVAATADGSSYPDAMSNLLWDRKLTVPWRAARDLWAMNERYIYVEDPPGCIYRPAIDKFLSQQEFKVDYGNRMVIVPRVNKKNEVEYQQLPAPDAWIPWPYRATASRLSFVPGAPPRAYLDDGSWNVWKDFAVAPREDREGIKQWQALLDYMFQPPEGATPEVRRLYRKYQRWFECWLAKPFQVPGFHSLTAVVLISEKQGVGKSLLGKTVGSLYGDYCSFLDNQTLSDSWNGWLRHKLFIHADDIDPRTREAREAQLKVYITEPKACINEKYQPMFTADNHANFLFTTNDIDAFKVNYSDRRYAIFRLEALACLSQ